MKQFLLFFFCCIHCGSMAQVQPLNVPDAMRKFPADSNILYLRGLPFDLNRCFLKSETLLVDSILHDATSRLNKIYLSPNSPVITPKDLIDSVALDSSGLVMVIDGVLIADTTFVRFDPTIIQSVTVLRSNRSSVIFCRVPPNVILIELKKEQKMGNCRRKRTRR